MKLRTVRAEELGPGEVIIYNYVDPPVNVTVLCWAEWAQDRFGRYEMRFWSRREDTGAEGYMTYGPGGVARVLR